MDQWVPVLVALVCFSRPTISRSWVGLHDQYDRKHESYVKSWHGDHDGHQHGWHHDVYRDPSPDYDSSEESSSEHGDDFVDHQGNDGFNHHGYHHNHESHAFGHHNHQGYGNGRFDHHGNPHENHAYGHYNHHDHHGYNHQGHDRHDYNNRAHQGQPGHNTEFPGLPQSSTRTTTSDVPESSVQSQPGQNVLIPALVDLSQDTQNREQDSNYDADRVIFPDSGHGSTTSSRSLPSAPSTDPVQTQAGGGPSSSSLLDVVICIRACPATSEYNPVCGTNNVTYNNPGILECARTCGVDVTLGRRAPCSPAPLPLSVSSPTTIRLVNNSTSGTPRAAQTSPSTTAASAVANPKLFTDIEIS